jgi:hypothetical protein
MPSNMAVKTVVGSLLQTNTVRSGDNLFRLDDLGGVIPRWLTPIRYSANSVRKLARLPSYEIRFRVDSETDGFD